MIRRKTNTQEVLEKNIQENKKILETAFKNDDYEKIIEVLNLWEDEKGEQNIGIGFYSLGKVFAQREKTFLNDPFTTAIIQNLNIDKDADKAINCFWKSLQNGFKPAMSKLNGYYYLNHSNKYDLNKALKLYLYGESINDPSCLYKLGVFYFWGKVVNQDYNIAKSYFERAFSINPKYGAYELGVIYENGYGDIKKDFKTALKYFQIGIDNNNTSSFFRMANILENEKRAKMYGIEKNDELTKIYLNHFLCEYRKHKNNTKMNDKSIFATSKLGKVCCGSENRQERIYGTKLLIRCAKRNHSSSKNYLFYQKDIDIDKKSEDQTFNIPKLVGSRNELSK